MPHLRSFLVVAIAIVLASCAQAAPVTSPAVDVYHYGIEIQDVLCGYAKNDVRTETRDGREVVVYDSDVFVMISALGSPVNTKIVASQVVDAKTGKTITSEADVDQGVSRLRIALKMDGNVAVIDSPLKGEGIRIEMTDDTIVETGTFYDYVLRDLGEEGKVTYPVLEIVDGEVQNVTYAKTGTETIELAGKNWDATVLERSNEKTGMKQTMWVETATGLSLKAVFPNGRKVYLAEPSVTKQVEVADVNPDLLRKTNVSIGDVHGITSMKVKAVLQPTGLAIRAEDLSVPGQRFEGTVVENRIEGIFTIEHPHYDGADAPPFPFDVSGDPAVAVYLEPTELLEADDPVLIAEARRITAGAGNGWEAAVRLSRWVADEIEYAIPGGLGARDTYDKRMGECGAHSMLLAGFARAVGIPARVVWGAMYVPNMGGAFGQHAWTELYMGKAGWIPVDATANEVDFADSGHIRLGEYQSVATALNPVTLEVLEHRVGTGEAASMETTAAHAPYLGTFTHPSGAQAIEVREQDGALTLDIKGKAVLAMNEPDEKGRWYAKMSDRLFATFETGEDGKASTLVLHELMRMPREADPESVEGAPDGMKRYLGDYVLPQLHATFKVVWDDAKLAVVDPMAQKTVHLGDPDEEGRRLDEFRKNFVAFEEGDEGKVSALILESVNRFPK